ncbi:peptidyl-tRNA hydrolase [Apiospora marii]|uniref:peptidyl-tRNA hydrolase n=1 Tax=Apiospora marii TaxID=335849 RepID=A0ABR1R6G1_9PEZI
MFSPRFLVISLGNTGPYYDTLHSAGHFALAAAQKVLGAPQQPRFSPERYGAKSCQASPGTPYTMLQSPTLMNVSGPWFLAAYRDTLSRYNLQPEELGVVLVHDDLEEDFGNVRIRKWAASHRGHNGIKSVNASMKNQHLSVSDYVLKKMTRYQKDIIDAKVGFSVVERLRDLHEAWEDDLERAAPKG